MPSIDEPRPTITFHGDDNESASIEKAERTIESHIQNAELESSRFQAFADFVDYRSVKHLAGFGSFSMRDAKLCLIEETIRQRNNTMRGYKKDFALVVTLYNTLEYAMYNTGDSAKDNAARGAEADARRKGELPRCLRVLVKLRDAVITQKM